MTEETREIVRKGLGAKFIDRYSAEETGIIARQCPKHDHLHILSPIALVEIVDENDDPCSVGQPGRVLVTGMQSYGMPLIRYELGDIAEWGGRVIAVSRSRLSGRYGGALTRTLPIQMVIQRLQEYMRVTLRICAMFRNIVLFCIRMTSSLHN